MKTNIIYNKSCLTMEEIEDNSIDTIVTSCPYYGLRDYGAGANQDWPDGWHGQLGLEPTLSLYLDHLLLITAECKRVLKPTGVLWWNHGDCYGSDRGGYFLGQAKMPEKEFRAAKGLRKNMVSKCLALQNYRLILRLIDEQEWVLRNTAIWNKPNSMPSSTKDRLTNKYEPVFFLVKNTKTQYYWNEKTGLMANRKPKVLKEGIDWDWQEVGIVDDNVFNVRVRDADKGRFIEGATEEEKINYGKGKLKKKSYWHSLDYWFDLDVIREKHKYLEIEKRRKDFVDKVHYGGQQVELRGKNRYGRSRVEDFNPVGKNPGDVWSIPTQPYPEAHFATFPEKLIIKPILSSCPEWICKKCGKARVRITKKDNPEHTGKTGSEYKTGQNANRLAMLRQAAREQGKEFTNRMTTIGWTDCGCNAGWRPGIILDPFAGSGTTLAMAKRYNRQYIGYEISKDYIPLIQKRLAKEDTLFNTSKDN